MYLCGLLQRQFSRKQTVACRNHMRVKTYYFNFICSDRSFGEKHVMITVRSMPAFIDNLYVVPS
jgi:hypothetical protein